MSNFCSSNVTYVLLSCFQLNGIWNIIFNLFLISIVKIGKPTTSWRQNTLLNTTNNRQMQPSIGVLKKRCSENMQHIYRRTPMPKCDFNKVAFQRYWNHTLACVFPVNFLHISRTPFVKNTSGRLPLKHRKLEKLTEVIVNLLHPANRWYVISIWFYDLDIPLTLSWRRPLSYRNQSIKIWLL